MPDVQEQPAVHVRGLYFEKRSARNIKRIAQVKNITGQAAIETLFDSLPLDEQAKMMERIVEKYSQNSADAANKNVRRT